MPRIMRNGLRLTSEGDSFDRCVFSLTAPSNNSADDAERSLALGVVIAAKRLVTLLARGWLSKARLCFSICLAVSYR